MPRGHPGAIALLFSKLRAEPKNIGDKHASNPFRHCASHKALKQAQRKLASCVHVWNGFPALAPTFEESLIFAADDFTFVIISVRGR